MPTRRFVTGVLALFLALAAPAEAQQGRLVGRILDAESARPLPGATVVVQGTRLGTIAGVDGRYILLNAPVGEIAVQVSMLGYASKTVTGIRIDPGAALQLDVTLSAQAIALEGLTVSVERERGSVSRVLDEQRRAVGVVSAISSEQIGRSPDGDAGAAIQRVSGVTVQDGRSVFVRGLGERYTTVSLNGARVPSAEPDRKVVPLDLFPAGLLQTITTLKSFTPNLPGDFSGAQVDIRTREFPAHRQTTVSVSAGYNPEVVGRSLVLAPTAGGEWMANATSARQMPAAIRTYPRPQPGEQANEIVNSFRPAWTAQERDGAPSGSFGALVGGSDELLGRTVGYLFSGTYSAGFEANLDQRRAAASEYAYAGMTGRHSVLWGGLLNLSTTLGTHTRVGLNNTYNRSADNEARRESGLYENHGTTIQIDRLRYVERVVRSSQLQVEHQLTSRQRLDWAVTLTGVERQEPDRSEFVLWMDPATPTWYNQEGAFRAFGGLTDAGLEGSVDYRLELGSRTRPHTVRLGALTRANRRAAWDEGYSIRTREWSPADPRWQLPPEEFFDGRYAGVDDALFEVGTFNAGGSYELRDQLSAGYGMLDLALGSRLQLVGGARVERSALAVDFESILGETGTARPAYTDVLPAVVLNYDLTERQKLRVSATRTLARPEYREMVPFPYREGLGEDQVQGNPELRRTLIRNYDLRWEFYPAPGELLAIALFTKDFSDPIERRYLARSGTNTLAFENAVSALNHGVEAEFVRNLGFLMEPLRSFSLFANATWMRSTVETGREGDEQRAMVGQAPYVLNAGLNFASPARTTSATLLYNIVGPRIVNARPSGSAVLDVVEQPRPMLDLSVRFPLSRGMTGRLDLKNLLDSRYEERQGDVVRRAHRSGRSFSLGASWRL